MMLDTISAKKLDWYIEDGSSWLIDVRSEEAFREMHIRGAVNIPQGELRPGQHIPQHIPLILYCERGASSMAVARKLAEKGYRVKTVVGGIRAYRGKYMVRENRNQVHG